jgi:hypothetical protein
MTLKLVKLQKEEKYELMEPNIQPSVILEEDMLDVVENMKFADHELSDEKKFLELALKKYMRTTIFSETVFILVEPRAWAPGLEKSRILNLLDILHFARSVEINACFKILLRYIHGGYRWINIVVSIDTKLIL